MPIAIEDIKKLREETGAGILDVKKALENADGDFDVARKELEEKGIAKAAKKADRIASDGLVHAYVHSGGKLGSMVVVACETDFVARTDDFKKLCQNITLQVCAGEYATVDELLEDDYIKDPGKKVSDLVTEAIAKLGEKIEIKEFAKLSV